MRELHIISARNNVTLSRLTVTTEAEGVASLPGGSVRTTNDVVGSVSSLAETTRLATRRGEATAFAVLVHRVADPVNTSIIANDNVVRVDENHLEVFVSSILVHPVGVQHTEVSASTAHTLLCNAAEVAHELELVDTLVLGLTIYNTTRVGSLAATATHGNTVHNVSLLSLISKLVGLVRASGALHTGDFLSLAVLPGSAAI